MNQKALIEPFMYINQPTFNPIKVSMQTDYHSGPRAEEIIRKEESHNMPTHKEFRDLSIVEKIKYLLEMPPEMPPILCEVQTEVLAYQGVMVEETDEEIILRVAGRAYETIQKEIITQIYLIGF